MKIDKNLGEEFLKSYYESDVWRHTTFLGIHIAKSVADLWNYQEILFNLKPKLVVEFGSHKGGSALYFASLLSQIHDSYKVFSVDISHELLADKVKNNTNIELLECSSTDSKVYERIAKLRNSFSGPMFVIVDSDHSKDHVLKELENLRTVTKTGDYIVVEDGIVNGNPVLADYGVGPLEAVEEYFLKYPTDYTRDEKRENKFGFTFAPKGFLTRN